MSANTVSFKVFAANKAGKLSQSNKTMLALKSHINVTVSASAGSGKTYLLVSRIICLLLDGSAPNSIVAITFTRKAAGEMAERLNERLYELASIDEQQLIEKLQALGLDSSYSERARLLYETLLLNPQSVKITTFHAFCHDLLQRFPLEADINPGFELLESSTLLKHQAWQRLLDSARKKSSSDINTALDHLFNECSNPNSVEELLLNDFLEHRSDWWAFTENQLDPVAYATRKIRNVLQLETQSHEALSLSDSMREQLKQFSLLLEKNKNKTNSGFALTLNTLLAHTQFDINKLQTLHAIFFTTDKNPTLRKRNPSKAQAKRMGETSENTFIALHHSLSQAVADLLDRLHREKTATISHAWYTVGSQLLTLFQTIKHEQNCLDFSDLEWQVYKLLSNSEQSHWVQYKLDQRIDHILIDEFQDTNPTQWQMLYPLLEEITGQTERQRSVFIVGDGKQSIYRFRRAAPDLFIAAQSWLEEQPAPNYALRLDKSRRSSPAIINLINQVFSVTNTQGATSKGSLAIKGEKLVDFQTHDTVHQDLWGRTELLPLIVNETLTDKEEDPSDQSAINNTLRNPLVTPREVAIDQRYQQEGQLIAQKISALIENDTAITDNGVARVIHYGDIMILVKKRRHVADYENALLAAGIPFISTQRKSLLSTLEIQDMLSLCNTLLTPHSNLTLAVVLRSPIFACSNKDLSTLATASDDKTLSWYARLTLLEQPSPTLERAATLLRQWQALTGKLPMHDLLDRIYHQGNIIARYIASFPSHYVAKVKANLTRFIELALEIDSGRYPSLQKFIYHLELLDKRKESPNESLLSGNKQAVRLLTIHSAKGLEAPVVFIADASNQKNRGRRHHSLIDWPADKKQPDYFFLSSMYRDSISKHLLDADKQKEAIEDANLLYVAMTRARQLLFISAVEPSKGDWRNSWYGQIAQHVDDQFDASRGWSAETATQPQINAQANKGNIESSTLSNSNNTTEQWHNYSPLTLQAHVASQADQTLAHAKNPDTKEDLDTDAVAYGNAIHRLLELLSSDRLHTSSTSDEVVHQLRTLSHNLNITVCWHDTLAVYTAPELQNFFDATRYQNSYNEVNINTIDGQGQQHFGVIDRLIVNDKSALIIDYKSQQYLPHNLEQLAEEHRKQLSRYRVAVKLLWPEKTVSAAILFTAQRKLIELVFQETPD